VGAALLSLAAAAAGADGSWTWCSQPARLQPDWSGRALYVATWGNDPGWCPGANYTFRTIPAAARCAQGKDTIYVYGGTYGPVTLTNLWPSARVLITNVSGQQPIIEGWGGVGDYASVFGMWRVGNIAVQGLEVRNTGVPDANHGGYGIRVSESDSVQIYFNTVHDTARHGIITSGSSMEVVGNEVYNTVMRNQWFQSSYWDAAVASDPAGNQWGYKIIGNSIHDSYGECADVLAVDGATVQGNKIYNCVSTNVFVSNSQNITVDRNWIFENTDKYNRRDYNYRATGIQLANESSWVGWSLKNVRITNNIVEWVSQAVRYWKGRTGGSVRDTYGSLYVGFNDFNRTQFGPIRFDTPDGWWPSANSRLRQNLVINTSSNTWLSTENWSSWDVTGNWNYGWNTTATNPGIKDTYGTYFQAYELRSGAAIGWTVAPWSEWDMPPTDYLCQSRSQNNWNTPGAIN
jgi:hypothetical protein